MPVLNDRASEQPDFYFIKADETEVAYEKLLEVLGTWISQGFGPDPVRDIQAFIPMNRSGLGAKTLNVALQKHFNPAP